MDSMFAPEKYTNVYWYSFLYIFTLTMPHSVAVQTAWPDQAVNNGELAHHPGDGDSVVV